MTQRAGLPLQLSEIDWVTFGWGWGGVGGQGGLTEGSKTAWPPEKQNASLWRLNALDCVRRRVWKEEGGEACDV